MKSAEGKRLYIQEVSVRDGFQIEPKFIPTQDKIDLVNRLSRTGLAKIEVTSFVSPKAIPALADAEKVMTGIDRVPGVLYAALVPNVCGCERALACDVDEINLVMSASDSGLGGCPFAPGATGNVCTEDLVHMFESMGCDTRVDLDKLLAIARDLPAIVDHDVPGQVMKAGPSDRRYPLPASLLADTPGARVQ